MESPVGTRRVGKFSMVQTTMVLSAPSHHLVLQSLGTQRTA